MVSDLDEVTHHLSLDRSRDPLNEDNSPSWEVNPLPGVDLTRIPALLSKALWSRKTLG